MIHPTRSIGPLRSTAPTAAAEPRSLRELQRAVPSSPRRYGSGRMPDEVTPDKLAYAIRAARGGQPAALFAALEFFYRMDDVIPGAVTSLVEAVLQSEDLLTPVDDSDEALAQVEDLRLLFDDLDLVELLREGLECRYFGFRAAQPIWDTVTLDNGRTLQAPVSYELLPRDWVYAAKALKGDAHTTLFVGDRPYHEYPNGAVLLFADRKPTSYQDIDFTRFGCGLATARFAVYSYFNHQDWAGYNEVFGQPTIVGTLLQGWGNTDRELLEQAVFGVSNDSRGILTDKAKLDTFEASAGGSDVFDRSDRVWREARSRIIKSESLTDSDGKTGTYGTAVTVNGIRLAVAGGMARRLERMIQRRLVDVICGLNYGRCLVKVNLAVREVENLVQEMTIDKGLLDMGVALPAADVYARYNRRAPEEDEEALTRRPSSGLGNLFGGG